MSYEHTNCISYNLNLKYVTETQDGLVVTGYPQYGQNSILRHPQDPVRGANCKIVEQIVKSWNK